MQDAFLKLSEVIAVTTIEVAKNSPPVLKKI